MPAARSWKSVRLPPNEFVDTTAAAGETCFYRVVQVNAAGTQAQATGTLQGIPVAGDLGDEHGVSAQATISRRALLSRRLRLSAP